MLNDINNWHPLPRYGLAAAVFAWQEKYDNRVELPELSVASLAKLAGEALSWVQLGFLLQAHKPEQALDAELVVYTKFNDPGNLNPGSKSGQNAANGFFLAPHVLTSNNSGAMVTEFRALQKALTEKLGNSFQLKRSFSPQTSKINAGSKSMSDPKDDVLIAAYTAIGSATSHKAAALDRSSYTNIGLVPDLPFVSDDHCWYPLLNYIKMLSRIQSDLGDAYIGKFDPKANKYVGRPAVYRGNFRYALNNINFGSLSLIAAFSGLIELGKAVNADEVTALVKELANRPIMIIGYDRNGQEQFGNHLSELTEQGILYRMLEKVWQVELVGIESGKKYKSPRWDHFKRNLDRWLRRYDASAFRGFLSVRATYPESFLHPLYKYFTMQKISKEIVDSAMAMGKSLNRAAYRTAEDKAKADRRQNGRDKYEYKARVLSSLEGNIRSAKTGSQLLSQVSTLVGRMTNYDLSPESSPFMQALLTGEIDTNTAKDLLIAFMRLNQSDYKVDDSVDDESEDEAATANGFID